MSDSQLTDGSHYRNYENHAAKNGRLFDTIGASAWCGGYDASQRTSGIKKLFVIYLEKYYKFSHSSVIKLILFA